MINSAFILGALMIAMVVHTNAIGFAPEDEQVSAYLESQGLDALLEVQLFDRLDAEKDPEKRLEIAEQLATVYLGGLAAKDLDATTRQGVLIKGHVLVGMMPSSALLELRLELLVQQYVDHERAADLDRIGLLDPTAKDLAVGTMKNIVPEFARIAKLADAQASVLNRTASRSNGQRQGDLDRKLAKMIGLRSRANFFYGWAGYSFAALNESEVGSEVFRAFGWVLGLKGSLPVLDRMDLDLLEYDHVARSMLGVALCKASNQDYGEARVWFKAVEGSDVVPQFAVEFAHQRQLEMYLGEKDWIASERAAIRLRDYDPESLLGVAQARLLVIRTLESVRSGQRGGGGGGRGGSEGVQELARMGLERLIDLGEIGHVLELHERFGALPLLSSGFVSLYTQGLSELARGEESGENSGFAQAGLKFNQALQAEDSKRYGSHAADAVLKFAYCELRQGRAGEAVAVLTRFDEWIVDDKQREESAWLMILAHDAAVRGGQDQMSEQMTILIGKYLRAYPSTERANTLIVRYAMTPHIEAVDAIGSLVIVDPSDKLAIPARRKLIQLLYKNPELIDGGEVGLHEAIVGHAAWLWSNEPTEAINVREGRERLAVCRIVLATGMVIDSPDLPYLDRVIERAMGVIDAFSALDDSRSELSFRRVQVLLMGGDYLRAGEIAMTVGVLDESVVGVALLMVYGQAIDQFESRPSVPGAQGVIRYGREAMEISIDDPRDGLDRRLSLVAEGMAAAAAYIADELNDASMREYATALSLRIFHEGHPTAQGLVRTAELGEAAGHSDTALECWLRLVGSVSDALELWHRARYESLRLLMATDPQRGRAVYSQYIALQPLGSPEPWGGMIEALFAGEVEP